MPEELSMAANTGRKKLGELCREHVPELQGVWDDVFSAKHEHRLHPSKDVPGDVVYRVPGTGKGKDKAVRTTLHKYLVRQQKYAICIDTQKNLALVREALLPPVDKKTIENEFTILRGKDVVEAYANAIGSKSCMTGKGKPVLVYAMFPEKVGLLVWKDKAGRALLWTSDAGVTLVDRVYAGDLDLAQKRYREWAKASDAEMFFRESGKKHFITLGPGVMDIKLPYFDAPQFMSKDGVLCNWKQPDSVWQCHHQDGGKEWIGQQCMGCSAKDHLEPFGGKHLSCKACALRYGYCKCGTIYAKKDAYYPDAEELGMCRNCAAVERLVQRCYACDRYVKDVVGGRCDKCRPRAVTSTASSYFVMLG